MEEDPSTLGADVAIAFFITSLPYLLLLLVGLSLAFMWLRSQDFPILWCILALAGVGLLFMVLIVKMFWARLTNGEVLDYANDPNNLPQGLPGTNHAERP